MSLLLTSLFSIILVGFFSWLFGESRGFRRGIDHSSKLIDAVQRESNSNNEFQHNRIEFLYGTIDQKDEDIEFLLQAIDKTKEATVRQNPEVEEIRRRHLASWSRIG